MSRHEETGKSKYRWLMGGVAAAALLLVTDQPGAIADEEEAAEEGYYHGLDYRLVGPFRGGRSTAVTGVDGDSLTYFMGITGGGVWKTEDAGQNWENISDGYFNVGSIGALDVANSDPNVIFVGSGTADIRGVAVTHGDGVYRSTDGGETWDHVGLADAGQISGVVIHPTDPDVVYVAVQGAAYAPTQTRGVYRTRDGGETWERVLHIDETTGAASISMDATNPRHIYVTMWDHQRQPWEIRSGGPGSGIYKSTDGGTSWEELTEGLPDLMGKIGVSVSPANPKRVWAIVEAEEKGGLYRSDDGGESFTHVNGDRRLHARSWYYMHVKADPVDENTVYVMNSGFYRSVDSGKSVESIRGPHGDYHDMWINPDNPDNMISANDGGGTVSFDGGESWSTIHNQPTAQFYRVNTDNGFPYRIYAGQQDNSTVAIRSTGLDGGIGRDDYFSVGGCESAFVDMAEQDPRYVYAGCYLGQISEHDLETGFERDIRAYPELSFGVDPAERRYRFNWNAPIVVSDHNPDVVYHAGNVVLRTTDRGQTWEEASPDLTRDEEDKQGPMGGPITNEVSENYNTIAYLEESPHSGDVLWAGSDDGLLHVTLDGGATWANVTPDGIEDGLFNAIDVSPHDPDTAYVAYTRYKYNDHAPRIFKTTDGGQSWENIADGIPDNEFVRVVREDPARAGLLFAGTEKGIHVSFNGGEEWQELRLNLPVVPVTDLKVHEDDLVISTQGRAFWVLDNISPLRQISDEIRQADAHLFAPAPAFRMNMNFQANPGMGDNPPNGAVLYYHVGDGVDLEEADVTLTITNADGEVVREFGKDDLEPAAGINRFVWNLMGDPTDHVEGLFQPAAGGDGVRGYTQPPGTYQVSLGVGDTVTEQTLTVTQDPRSTIADAALAEKQQRLQALQAMIGEMARTIKAFRTVKSQIDGIRGAADAGTLPDAVDEAATALEEAVTGWEDSVVHDEREFFQDVLNWPDLLYDDLQFFYGSVSSSVPPLSAGMNERFADLSAEWEEAMAARDAIVEGELAAFNEAYRAADLPPVILPSFDVVEEPEEQEEDDGEDE